MTKRVYAPYFDERRDLTLIVNYMLAKGWQPRQFNEVIGTFDMYRYGTRKVTFFTNEAIRFFIPVYELVFNHAFALTLWGDGNTCSHCGVGEMNKKRPGGVEHFACQHEHIITPTWQYHLQKMALARNPVEYMIANMPPDYKG